LAGIRYPVALTRTVWERCIAVPPGVLCQAGRHGCGTSPAARLCDPPLRRRPFGALRCPRPQRQPGANAAARPPPPL